MKNLVTILLLLMSLSASAEDRDTTNVFLDKFEKFVVSIERNDSVINWEQSNAEYKALRMEYRSAHKKRINSEQYARYNNLKARYVKQVSLKKVGGSITRKTNSISSAVKGTVDGVIGK